MTLSFLSAVDEVLVEHPTCAKLFASNSPSDTESTSLFEYTDSETSSTEFSTLVPAEDDRLSEDEEQCCTAHFERRRHRKSRYSLASRLPPALKALVDALGCVSSSAFEDEVDYLEGKAVVEVALTRRTMQKVESFRLPLQDDLPSDARRCRALLEPVAYVWT
ncbi:hypothetical protein MKEN_01446600 [Mycena kentingensis (nom. inval.)]|nr:hypothetical protein MKEN_01446600 [Mycena kentingensis (nom. inval.)]